MELYDNFKSIKMNKIKSPKVKKSPLLKDYKKEIVKTLKNPKKIKILSNKKGKKKKFNNQNSIIPTELNIISNINTLIKNTNSKKSRSNINNSIINKDYKKTKTKTKSNINNPIINKDYKKSINKKKFFNKKKSFNKKKYFNKKKSINKNSRTISVKLNNKENNIKEIINKFNKMDINDIQKKLESKGIYSKNNNKDKLLKYMYLLTCVDDNINIIKD